MNTVTSSRIVPMSGSASDVNFPASGASRGFVGELTLSSGSKIQGADYKNYITYSLTSSFGTFTPDAEKYYGIVTVASRGATIGVQKSGTLTHEISGTINGVSINKTATLGLTQALNKVVSCTETNNTLNYPSIAAGGGTSSPSSTATATFKYSSGASGNPSGYTKSSSYSMTSGNGFSINTSTGVVTATNNTTTSSRTSNTITRTTKFSYTNPASVGGDTVSTTLTKTATCTQSAGTKTYANPVVSLSYATIPAKGGTVTPTMSYSQTWGWDGATSGGGTITSGATVSYSGTSVNTTNGSVTASSKGATPSNVTTVTKATVTVKLNGKTGTESFDVKQQANTVESYSYGSYTATLSSNSTSTLPAGATTRTITWGYIRRSKTPIYTSTSHGTATTETYSGTAYLTVSVSSGASYCSLNKSSYTNSSSTTSSTLTKRTYGTTEITTAQTYTLHVRMGSASGTSVASLSIGASTNVETEIIYGSWVVSVSANRYTTSSSPCPASGGTATITRSASRTRTQKYTSGATLPLSSETATPTLSISGTGFSLSDTTVTAANRSTTEGALRSATVTATHSGVSKSLTLYQAENKLTGVTITGSTSDGTVMNISAVGGKITWTPKVQYSSGSNVTPPSGVSITYSLNHTNIGASQSGNVTTWENRSAVIGAWRGVDVTVSATSSYTTKAVTGTGSTGQNMNTVTALAIRGAGDVDPLKSFTATSNSPGYTEKLTFSSGATSEGNNYKDYITFKFNQSWATWTPNSQKYFGVLNIASRGTTIGAARSGTLTCTISGTINGVSVNKSGTLTITQSLNKMTSITEVKSNTTYSPTTLSAAGGNSTPSYVGDCKLTFSSGSTITYPLSGWSGMEISRSWSLSSTTGFSIDTNSGVVTAAYRGTTIGAARSTVVNAKLTFSYTNPSTVGGDTVTGTDTDNITITQAANSMTRDYSDLVGHISSTT
jgi:hypothetical protein